MLHLALFPTFSIPTSIQLNLCLFCSGCNLTSRCCNSFEYCVTCCLNPKQVYLIFLIATSLFMKLINVICMVFQTSNELAIKVKTAQHASAGNFCWLMMFSDTYFLFTMRILSRYLQGYLWFLLGQMSSWFKECGMMHLILVMRRFKHCYI